MTPGRKFSTSASAVRHQIEKPRSVGILLEVEHHGALPGILSEKRCPHASRVQFRRGPELAGKVAALRLLDFDNVGAEQAPS